MTLIISNIMTGFHRNICDKIETVFNCLLFSAFFGVYNAVVAIPNLAHLFLQSTGKNKKAKSCPFKIGVLSALFCASHFRSVKGAKPAAARHFFYVFN